MNEESLNDKIKTCTNCKGKKRIIVGVKNKHNDPKYLVCPTCNGNGVVETKKRRLTNVRASEIFTS